jgi:hypothetical protein
MRPERGVGVVLPRRNRRFPVAEAADSGEIFQQPWGVSGTGGRGEMERTGRASYRRGEASDRASIEEELKEEVKARSARSPA